MRKMSLAVFTLPLLAAFVLVATTQAAEKHKGYVRGEIFITAQELNPLVQAKDPKLVAELTRRIEEWARLHPSDGVRESAPPDGYKAPALWVEAAREG